MPSNLFGHLRDASCTVYDVQSRKTRNPFIKFVSVCTGLVLELMLQVSAIGTDSTWYSHFLKVFALRI